MSCYFSVVRRSRNHCFVLDSACLITFRLTSLVSGLFTIAALLIPKDTFHCVALGLVYRLPLCPFILHEEIFQNRPSPYLERLNSNSAPALLHSISRIQNLALPNQAQDSITNNFQNYTLWTVSKNLIVKSARFLFCSTVYKIVKA